MKHFILSAQTLSRTILKRIQEYFDNAGLQNAYLILLKTHLFNLLPSSASIGMSTQSIQTLEQYKHHLAYIGKDLIAQYFDKHAVAKEVY